MLMLGVPMESVGAAAVVAPAFPPFIAIMAPAAPPATTAAMIHFVLLLCDFSPDAPVEVMETDGCCVCVVAEPGSAGRAGVPGCCGAGLAPLLTVGMGCAGGGGGEGN